MNDHHPTEKELLQFASGDLESRFEEVAAHLEGCQQCGDVLRKTGAFPKLPAGDERTDVHRPMTEGAGSRVGPYKLLQQLGEGGMGVVYMAEQERPVRRIVALKIIKPGMDSSQVIARFEAERQALAMMDHHNIAKVLDAGTTDTGRPYFAMELVKGVPITQYCDRNKLTPRERLEMFIPVCQAIQHAHQKGIIHRDIKPSNVLVTLYDGKPVPKVIDFGVAKATQQKLTERTMFTGIGQILGTFEYMSPEQAEMNQLDIDTRSDVYSLGVILYELLTGSTPISKEKLRSAGLEEMLRTIRETEPPKPSTRLSESARAEPSVSDVRKTEPAKLSKLIRGDLDWIVMKALEKDRTRRYETANGLAMDVQRFLDDETVEACPPSASYRFRKFARRHKTAFVAGTATATILVLATIMSSISAVRAFRAQQVASANEFKATRAAEEESKARQAEQKQREIAVANAAKANREATKSKEVATFLKDMLEGVGPSVARGRDTQMLQEILNKLVERLDTDLDAYPDVEAELRMTIGRVYQELSQPKTATEMYRQALELRKREFGEEHTLVAESLIGYAKSLRDESKTRELLQQALAMREKLFGPEHLDVAAALDALGGHYHFTGKSVKAENLRRRVLAIRRKWLGENDGNDSSVYSALLSLGVTVEAQGRYEEAAELIEEGRQIAANLRDGSTLLGERSRRRQMQCETILGRIRKKELRYADAEEHFRRAITFYESLKIPDVQHLFAISNLAQLLWEQQRLEEAEHWVRRELELTTHIYNEDSGWRSNSLIGLGLILADQEKWQEAKASLENGLVIREKVLPNGDGHTINALCGLAHIHEAQGSMFDALEAYQQALTVAQDNEYGYPIRGLSVKLADFAREKLANLEAFSRQPVERLTEQIAAQQNGTRDVLFSLANELIEHGRADEAEAVIRKYIAVSNVVEAGHNVRGHIAQCVLGRAFVSQGRYADAEATLLKTYAYLRESRIAVPVYQPTRHLVDLYERRNNTEAVEEWTVRLREDDSRGLGFVSEVLPPYDGIAPTLSCLAISPNVGHHVYASSRNSGTLDVFARDPEKGELKHIQTTEDENALNNISGLQFDRTGKWAACVNNRTVLLFRRNTTDGRLELLCHYRNLKDRTLQKPRHVAFSRDSRFLFVSDDATDVKTNDQGAIVTLKITGEPSLQWQAIHRGRNQCFRDARGLAVHPNGRWLYTSSSESDALTVCAIDADSGNLNVIQVLSREQNGLESLSKPCRVVCSHDGTALYVSGGDGESGAVGVFAIGDHGRLSVVQQLMSATDEIGPLKVSASSSRAYADGIAVSPDGSALYACSRKSGTLARFDRDRDTGKLTFVETVYLGPPDGGPIDLCFSPDSKFLYVAIRNTMKIIVLRTPQYFEDDNKGDVSSKQRLGVDSRARRNLEHLVAIIERRRAGRKRLAASGGFLLPFRPERPDA